MKKIISILLSALMVLSVMPMTVFAADGDVATVTVGDASGQSFATVTEAIAAVQATGKKGTVALIADVAEDIVIAESNVAVTFQTKGFNITNVSGSTIVNNGKVDIYSSGSTITNNATNAIPTVVNAHNAALTITSGTYTRESGKAGYIFKNEGTATISPTTLTKTVVDGTSLVANGWYVNADSVDKTPATLTIKGGTFSAGKLVVKNDANGILNISGGTFTSDSSFTVQNWNVANISNGTFNSKIFNASNTQFDGDETSVGKMTITGGTFKSIFDVRNFRRDAQQSTVPEEGPVATVTIKKGTFTEEPKAEYIDPASMVYPSSTGYKVAVGTTVAKVGDIEFPSLVDACVYAPDGSEVDLLTDVSTTTLTSINNKAITINLNGNTIKNPTTGSALVIGSMYADVTINGPGSIIAGQGNASTSMAAAISFSRSDCKLTINGGDFYSFNDKNGGANSTIFTQYANTTVIVNGGNFYGKTYQDKYYALNAQDKIADSCTFYVNGGTFNAPITMDQVVVKDGYEIAKVTEDKYTVQKALDYSAFDAVIVTAGAVNREAYKNTDLDALDALVASYDRAAFADQAEIDAAADAIQTAINALTLKTFSVVVYVNGEVWTDDVYSYGDTAIADITSFTECDVQKWVVEKNDVDTLIPTNEKVVSIIVNADMVINAYTQAKPAVEDVPEGKLLRKYSFLSKAGAVVDFKYAYVDEIDCMAMPEAPEVPFYDFVAWNQTDERTFVAVYEPKAQKNMCQIIAGEGILVNGYANITVQYDDVVRVTKNAAGKVALANDAEGNDIITYLNDEASFHCPMTARVYVVLVEDTDAAIGVTGTYYYNGTLGTNAQYYLPAGAKLIECGVIYTANNRDLKLKSTKQTANNEFTVELTTNLGSLASIDTRAYLTYEIDGNVKTVESSKTTISLK